MKHGKYISCEYCFGHGLIQGDFDPNWPTECWNCNGTGRLYVYKSGTIVTHPYGGQLRGKISKND